VSDSHVRVAVMLLPCIVLMPCSCCVQDMASWVRDGIGGLQSVVLYSLPELDGAIDTGKGASHRGAKGHGVLAASNYSWIAQPPPLRCIAGP
jgi:hypothetical protein